MYKAELVIDTKGKNLMPGFINTHCHSYYRVMCRGILTDLVLFLEQGAARYLDTLTPDKEASSTKAHLLEGIKRETTTFGDMGDHYNKLVSIHKEFGVRARISEMIREMPCDYRDLLGGEYQFDRKYAQESLDATYELLDKYGTDPNDRISIMVTFQALDYVIPELIIEL